MKKAFAYFLLSLTVFSCTDAPKKDVYDEIKKEFAVSSQVFRINPTRDTVLKCKYDTEIFIKENSFCYTDGTQISNEDSVIVEILEYGRLTDMILNNLTTTSGGNKIIETGGMLNINAKIQGKTIVLKDDKTFQVFFPSKPQDFKSFYAVDREMGQLDWVQNQDEAMRPVKPVPNDTSLYSGDTLKWNKNDAKLNVLSFNKLGWINCDRFLTFRDTTEIYVRTESNIDSSTFCSVILRNYNSIIPGKISQNGSMRFSPLPVNEPVTLFLIAYKDNSYYIGIKDVVVKSKETYVVNLEVVSKEQLKEKIEEFDRSRPL